MNKLFSIPLACLLLFMSGCSQEASKVLGSKGHSDCGKEKCNCSHPCGCSNECACKHMK